MKSKGTRAERELFHMLWETGIWACCRSAGSGSTPLPNPDLIASNGSKILAIECKAIKNTSKHFNKSEIDQLIEFSTKFGAEPWLAIKFDNQGWNFLRPEELKKTKTGNYSVNLALAKQTGKKFDELIGLFEQQKLFK
ncbi:MAG: Holliday junction resolvase Hjc [Nanoarchaeota archaeon]|nr:Holliday junction resolvase [Nanoarchaeota archaeon]MBU1444930.1 Holliday junction resolvase [Nanoarchaeota archaeon]MBU2420126.1 Holliday junction resolvase [Nanoarchaeota archaeon]MBU2475685.1 Holliday junction resolvase [Nanoarchaeota archaeon]